MPAALSRLRTAATGVAALGLAVSLALLIDYLRPLPTFCDAGGGCATVRASAWAHPLGVPMPIFGVLHFAAVLVLLHVPRARRLVPWLAAAGAVLAVGLLAVQGAVLGTWCQLCVVADASAILLVPLAVALRGHAVPVRPRAVITGAALAALAVGLPVIVAVRSPEPRPVPVVATAALPDVVAREQRPGVVTVVDFIDFECPFCRRFHPRLMAALAAVGGPVRVVKKMVPLDRIHRGARAAALAWCCADEQGAGDAMAEALFAAPPEELTPEGCERIAARLGLDMDRYRACVTSQATQQRVASDLAAARAGGLSSLPTVYIGDQRFVGIAASQADLEAALRTAIARIDG
jgi:protein-disulfide isomerase